MSDCNVCCISYDGDIDCSFYSSDVVKARKPHVCGECRRQIAPGEDYERVTGKWDGEISRHFTCLSCVEIRDKFSCDGSFLFGCVWDNIREDLLPVMTTGCLQGLGVTSKKRLMDAWMEWKFGAKYLRREVQP